MYKFQLYISGEKIDLFKDETITLNSTVQNIRDISKVFTDFTQSFTIPTSQINNKIFDHWYNVDITQADGATSFDSAVRVNATIELNHMPFRTGLVQLDKVQIKNNVPYSYKITFFGDLVNLSDLFGEDVLNDLDLSAFNHTYTSANVEDGLDGTGLSGGSVIYPLISPVRNWLWDSDDVDDIEYESSILPSTTNGINWYELKPAIKLNAIIEAIETKYSITFSNDFFNTSNHFDELFMWANKEEGYMNAYGVPTLLTLGGNTSFSGTVSGTQTYPGYPTETIEIQRFTLTVTPSAGFEAVEYSIIIDDAVTPITHEKTGTGTAVYEFSFPPPTTIVLEFKVQSDEPFTFTANLKQWTREWKDTGGAPLSIDEQTILDVSTASTVSINGKVYFTDEIVDGVLQLGQMPKMRVGDFISSLFKMFNLTILATSPTAFTVMPLDDWYAEGVIYNIDEYVFANKSTITRPDLNKRISYNYVEGETILAKQFKNTNVVGYGDLEADFDYDGGVLDIDTFFENIIFERLSSQQTGALSDVHVGKIIDNELESVEIAPIIFYNRGTTTISGNGIAFISDASVRSEVTTYSNIGQEDSLVNGSITQSLNFGSEVSTWTLTVQIESLYSNFWEDYVSDLYDKKRRVFDFEAILPLNVITVLKLNDILIIKEKSYIINNMRIDFTTGKTKLQLLNYIGDLTGIPTPAAPTSLTLTEGTI